jgi:hypothetical protein
LPKSFDAIAEFLVEVLNENRVLLAFRPGPATAAERAVFDLAPAECWLCGAQGWQRTTNRRDAVRLCNECALEVTTLAASFGVPPELQDTDGQTTDFDLVAAAARDITRRNHG